MLQINLYELEVYFLIIKEILNSYQKLQVLFKYSKKLREFHFSIAYSTIFSDKFSRENFFNKNGCKKTNMINDHYLQTLKTISDKIIYLILD